MRVWAISLMHNEEDIVRQSIDNMILNKVDGIIVTDILSNDRTVPYLEDRARACRNRGIQFHLLHEKKFGYYQAIKFNAMADMAHDIVGKQPLWIIPFDCDELPYCPFMPLADYLKTKAEHPYLWCNMRNFINTNRDDPYEADPIKRMKWYLTTDDPRMEPSNVKVAYTWGEKVWLELGAHRTRMADMKDMREDGGHRGKHIWHKRAEHAIIWRHYPVRDMEQMKRKYRANGESVKVAGLERHGVNTHSVKRGDYNEVEMLRHFHRWHFSASPELEGCKMDDQSWRRAL